MILRTIDPVDDSLTARRLWRALLLAAALSAVLATRVASGFDPLRFKLVQTATVPVHGSVQADLDRLEPARRLAPPFAVIARIRNDSPAPQRFTVLVDNRAVCSRIVPNGGGTHRVDCAAREPWRPQGSHSIAVAGENSTWQLSYLEIATHHGSTLRLDLVIVPAGFQRYDKPSMIVLAMTLMVFALVFLMPVPAIPRVWTNAHRVASAASAALLVLVFISPYVSNYTVLVSTATFVALSTVIMLPRLWEMAGRIWRRTGPRGSHPLVASAVCGLLVLVMYGAVVAHRLHAQYHDNYSGFLQVSRGPFDRNPMLRTRGDVRGSLLFADGGGYDSQFLYFMTFDPFLRRFHEQPETYALFIDAPPYRFGRIGFSLLTRIVAGRQWQLYPKVMMWLILASLFVCGAALAGIAQLNGATPLWGLLVLVVPGFWQSVQAGLPEPVAAALLLAGFLCWSSGRLTSAGVFFAVSLLVRETGALLLLAILAGMLWSGNRRDTVRLALISFTPVVLWRLYVGTILYRSWGIDAFWANPHDMGVPFAGIVDLWSMIGRGDYYNGVPELTRAGVMYPIVLVSGLALAVLMTVQKFSAPAVAAICYGAVAISLSYSKIWGHVGNGQRGTYELFVVLALLSTGLHGYARPVRLCCAAFWALAAAYVFFGTYDAAFIRSALTASRL